MSVFDFVTAVATIVGLVISIAKFIPWAAQHVPRQGLLLASGSTLITFSLATWFELIAPTWLYASVSPPADRLIAAHVWISYEPRDYDPNAAPNPSAASIARDLALIHRARFTGITTFSSAGSLADIPRIATRFGLTVIMGIWDPTSRYEVAAAVKQRHYVSGYIVGTDRVESLYSSHDLCKVMRQIRARTHRPVSTIQALSAYTGHPCFVETGDWLSPDVHVTLRREDRDLPADGKRDARETLDAALQIDRLRKSGQPVLLEFVTYPVAGAVKASPQQQARFFRIVFEARRSPRFPRIGFCAHSAFDTPWKVGWPFYRWDRFTGLFDSDGKPRPAVAEIVSRPFP
jgi:exo-beta-1,3-glucanase (GH17 family)